MKNFWNIMMKDIDNEHFTKTEMVVYGILVPVVLVAIMGVAGWLETLCCD